MKGKVQGIYFVECVNPNCSNSAISITKLTGGIPDYYMTKKEFFKYLSELGHFQKHTNLWFCGSPCQLEDYTGAESGEPGVRGTEAEGISGEGD